MLFDLMENTIILSIYDILLKGSYDTIWFNGNINYTIPFYDILIKGSYDTI